MQQDCYLWALTPKKIARVLLPVVVTLSSVSAARADAIFTSYLSSSVTMMEA